ncbi:amidohydrolase family protein [Curtobacterium sp. Leaf261]|uniref:amidohydrolase family protein n=1 Tax=Curtobacterium sp. Leaf261 TaxID=1736311 RepID=UPI0009E91719|nr:amidohydrolase family protein [Curtobacterium sp. Leaf261]
MTAYDGPIVDAHHHFWEPRLGYQPWLRPDAAIPFRYGDYTSIKRDYLPPDLLRDAAGFDIVGTVTMETEWVESDPVGEVVYTEGIAQRYGLPTASVAHARLQDDDARAVLEELAEHDLVRAVRQKPGQASSADRAAGSRTLLSDPEWERGFAALADVGLDFELQTAWWQFDEAVSLFRRYPEIAVTINHAGLPSDRSPDGLDGWRRAMSTMAELPNVSAKISGIGVPGMPWTAANQREVVEGVVAAFGTDRVMFASNYPVDSLTATYAEIYGGFIEITAGWSRTEQETAFARNAVRVYRLPERILDPAADPDPAADAGATADAVAAAADPDPAAETDAGLSA